MESSLTDLFHSNPQISLIMSVPETKAEGNYGFHNHSSRGPLLTAPFTYSSPLCPIPLVFASTLVVCNSTNALEIVQTLFFIKYIFSLCIHAVKYIIIKLNAKLNVVLYHFDFVCSIGLISSTIVKI